MVRCVLDKKWSVEATADRFQVDAKTVRKWVRRFEEEGEAGLCDRSSRPKRSPNRTPRHVRRQAVRLRNKHRWGADHIGHELGLAPSTVQNILNAAGVGRLDSGDRATREPVVRYQRDRPGELIHVDIKKIAAIPDGGGWRTHGRHEAPTRQGVGYRYLHSAIDDRTRIVYSETHDDEQAGTAVGFWHRAVNWYASIGITVERVLTDNGSCYRSRYWINYNQAAGIAVKKTRPYRPQTNGKIERFHRILLEEWAYIQDWTSEAQREIAYRGFIHFYNHHRSHGALQWATPTGTLHQLPHRDNVPVMHT
jgi:transposase InsO family protein